MHRLRPVLHRAQRKARNVFGELLDGRCNGEAQDRGALMSLVYSFTVPGDPVAKGRARAFVRGGRVAHYTPAKTENYEARVAVFAKQAMVGAKPFSGAVALSVIARFSIPASWSKKRRQAALDGLEHVTKRPDLDNVVKAIKDGMNGIAWADDCQVVRLVDCRKVYAEQPGVDVIVAGLEAGHG